MTPNPFKDIQVFYDGLGNTAVSWILDERFDDPYPHYFELQFSKSSTGFNSSEYEVIANGQEISFLLDSKFRTSGYAGSAFYRVSIVTPAGTYLSDPKGISGNVDKKNLGILRELLRKENLVLRSDRGATAGYLFKRRYYGPRCSCTDMNTDTIVSASCSDCAGTGFKYGYFPGVQFPLLIMSPETSQAQISEIGAINTKAIAARCLVFPVAEAKDIWLERDTSRVYEIKKYSIISRYSYAPIAAQIELRELPLADTVNLIISSMRDVSISKSEQGDVYSTPIIIAENSNSIPKSYMEPVGSAGLVSAINSPFAELTANNILLSTAPKPSNPVPAVLQNITNTATKPDPVVIVKPDKAENNVNVVCDNDLDGGLY
jgi:hypothetical protein